MADFPSVEPDLEGIALIANNQIYDSILTGETQTASLSGAKWQCTPTFSNRNGKEARDLRAFIFNQSGVAGRFNYYPASIDNVGTHAGLGVVDGAGQVGSELVTKDWDANQPLLFAAGDYLTANGEMKMVTADVPVGQDSIEYDETNYMPSPFDPSGWPNNPARTTITNIVSPNPSGSSVIGEVEQIDTSSDSITDSSTFPVVAGNIVYCAVIAKSTIGDNGLRFRFFDSTGFKDSININTGTGAVYSGSVDFENVRLLTNGYYLIEIGKTVGTDDAAYGVQIYYEDGASSVTAPVIGNKINIQAAFAGISTDYPAKLRANATIPISPPLRTSPADGALIEADNPYFPARLESDDQSTLQVSAPVIYNSTFSIIEAF